jgi:hypothetical protein
VMQSPRHVQCVLPGREVLFLIRPRDHWQLNSYECGHPPTRQAMLREGYRYWHSFLEPWRHLEFGTPQAAAAFVHDLIKREAIGHN